MIFPLFANVGNHLIGTTFFVTFTILEILGRKVSVFIQCLSMNQSYQFSFFTGHCKLHISGEILSKINDSFPVRCLKQCSLKCFKFLNWNGVHSFEYTFIEFFCLNRMPYITLFCKRFSSRIIHFSLLHIILLQWSCLTCFPCLIRYNHRFSIHFQLT